MNTYTPSNSKKQPSEGNEQMIPGITSQQQLTALKKFELLRLVREMRMRQVDLELSNAKFQILQRELEAERDLFFGMFEFAPAGYFLMEKNGVIQNVNLIGASLFSTNKYALLGEPFSDFVADEDKATFQHYLHQVFEKRTMQNQIITLISKNRGPFSAKMSSSIILGYDQAQTSRMVISHVEDIHEERKNVKK